MNFRLPFACIALSIGGCDGIPKDQAGTLERIAAERVFRVGTIASGQRPVGPDRQLLLLRRISRITGARPSIEPGASEPLLAKLEQGELDLVVGELAPESPWGKRVTILPPLGERVSADGHFHLVAVARNGENGWISLLHREAREVATRP